MALRAVPDHPKFADLKARLECGRGVALGYLEAMWHFCGRFTPQGNIGKYSDAQIESWIEWSGTSGDLIQAMVETHWLDPDAVHRLIVHDWHEHADSATRASLRRKKLNFVSTPSVRCTNTVAKFANLSGHRTDTVAKFANLSGHRTDTVVDSANLLSHGSDEETESATVLVLPEPEPEPVPEPEPEPVMAIPPAPPRKTFDLEPWADRLYDIHIKRKDRALVNAACLNVLRRCQQTGANPDQVFADIEACLIAWNGTPGWREKDGQYAPRLAQWIEDRGYEQWPAEPATANRTAIDDAWDRA
jgi:hypothetical protein